MRLKSIKLAGFKSFVDPTTVPFPTNMTAIVGPNGCGKSNIIDAVRWVMGESSAKYLRGESMSDVIFNGSNSRKPVGQASIELLFDNSAGRAPGEYARFNEISVKRRVSREGQSEYFLNGARCRRRDITDLFLGTGLGPRSYAIIEQGMISRLIEAKPEELRVYIEEAAGISKYKERRRETENRMRRTRENLDRLNDLRDELQRQLQHLERQAQAAEKYRQLKQEERQLQGELAVLKWQALDQQLVERREALAALEGELEQALTERLGQDSRLDAARQRHSEQTEAFNRVQGRYYEVGADIARVEQSLSHHRERARQIEQELAQARDNQREMEQDLTQDQERLQTLLEELELLQPAQEEAAENAELASERLQEAERRMADWQQRWEEFSQRSASERQQAELAQSHTRHSEEALIRLGQRQSRLREEYERLQGQVDPAESESLREAILAAEMERDQCLERITALDEEVTGARQTTEALEQRLSAARERSQTLKGRLASHQAMLEDQLGQGDQALAAWLADQGLDQAPQLASRLDVEPGWEKAVESVLGAMAQAIVIPSSDGLPGRLDRQAPAGLSAVLAQPGAGGQAGADSLAGKVQGEGAGLSLLGQVRLAGDRQEALALQASLGPGESVVAPDGTWVGPDWIRLSALGADQPGVLERQALVRDLEQALESQETELEALESERLTLREQLESLEADREQARARLREAEKTLSASQSELQAHEARREQIDQRLERLQEDLEELALQREEEEERLATGREKLQMALDGLEQTAEEKENLLSERDSLRGALDEARQRARHDRDHNHQLQLQLQALRNQRDGLRDTLDRLQVQRERLAERVSFLEEGREGALAPLDDLEGQLEGLLEQRLAEENRLADARQTLEAVEQEVRDLEQARRGTEERIQSLREKLESERMQCQALEMRGDQHREQLGALETDRQTVEVGLAPEASESEWESRLEKLGQRIQRLGAINLAAIDEYRVQSERKTYLDDQHEDLTEALESLENAIRRIDRETRQRFSETFNEVNQGLQALFPKVFGGGSAYLDLTDDDLLETGVAIMARPPGKKNSTIHLLSGGEKALTAIALVFSIFQLNPAPFCMLDEVDAPLDDANVGRYARLVRDMAEQVQFIFITHNKISMELADQLMGVTMHEPGVSRLVSVDVAEAAELAEA